jgi:hypothetical protein
VMSDVCQEIEPLLPGYALDALDEHDAGLVLAHLRSCPSCQAALADYLAVKEGLLLSPPAVQPPSGLRRALAASVRPEAADRGMAGRLGLGSLAWAGVATLIILLAVNLVVLAGTMQMLRGQQASLAQMAAEQSRLAEDLRNTHTAMALGTYPSSEVVRVEGDVAYGTFVYDPDLKIAVLYAWGLDALPMDETYQAWLIDNNGGRTSGGVFRASQGARFTVFIVSSPSPVGEFRGLGVTIEPSGGSPSPSGQRVLAADF